MTYKELDATAIYQPLYTKPFAKFLPPTKSETEEDVPTTNFKMATRDWLSSLALFNKRRVRVRGAHYDHLSFNQHTSSSLLVLMCYLTSDGKSLA